MIIPPECGFAVWYYDKYKNWDQRIKENDGVIHEYMIDLIKAYKFENWKIRKEELLPYLLETKPPTYEDLVSSIYFFYGNRLKKTVKKWGDKNNFYLDHIVSIKEIFPGAKFIHLVRDGRTVACSYKKLSRKKIISKFAPKLPSDIEAIASEWHRNLSTITGSFARIDYEEVLEVRFEDLILNPVETLTQVCKFIGIDFEEQMLNYYSLTEKDGLEPEEFLQWKGKNKKPLLKEEVDRFKRELSPKEITTFESIGRTFLETYHYL